MLLHVGDKAEYDAGHIPGARFVALSAISISDRSATGLTLEMPPAEDLRHRLEALGISDTLAGRRLLRQGLGVADARASSSRSTMPAWAIARRCSTAAWSSGSRPDTP